MKIDLSGRVAIGTTLATTAKLTVLGDIEIYGANSLIQKDTVTGDKYRITIASGVVVPVLI